ncbi:MAG: UDP-N-acetylmuramoyl-L-alanine--D-glutamate ligase [Roseburia sp.]
MDFNGKKVLVFGTGKSGIAAAELIESQTAAELILFEGNQDASAEEIRKKSSAFSEAELYIGSLPEEVTASLDIAVLSPGVPTDLPVVEKMKADGVCIIGEIELAYQLSKGRVAAITGTNGKTTTTTLVGEIMEHYFDDVKVVGNIGIPYTSVAASTTDKTVTVAEISSFQLETIIDFAPEVSAILNITPDHLNRHHTMENYIHAKEDITKNQRADQVCVLNYEDPVLREFGENAPLSVLFFSSKQKVRRGCYLQGEEIWYTDGTREEQVINVNELNILGVHNYENVMAATAMSLAFGVPLEKIREVLVKFQAVEHRIEYVTEKRGVRFYNDSKGTNPDAAIKAVQAMNRPTVLIGGGYDKQSEYDEWIESFGDKVKKLVLIGVTAQKIADCAEKHGFTDYVFAKDLKEAVEICYDSAEAGDAVLLSPACASWDMFQSYEQRGRLFKEYVHGLKE